MTLKRKAEHVRKAKQTRLHTCHWPGCGRQVPPANWGCATHWFKLPIGLRRKLWRVYTIGQEETFTPSREYIKVAKEIQEWIAHNAESKTELAHSDTNKGTGGLAQADDS
jgi:hypothetical protein